MHMGAPTEHLQTHNGLMGNFRPFSSFFVETYI